MISKSNLILAIDTSCDDTSAAVTSGTMILSNVIASQTQLHKEYGGVFPTVAKQAHKENINAVVAVALKRAKVNWTDISAIAVTQGPGLAPALEVGINKAIELSKTHGKPLISVNHLEGHLLSVLAKPKTNLSLKKRDAPYISHSNLYVGAERFEYPTLGLLVSGGNTLFVLVKSIGDYQILGSTVDDAAGECLDKVGRMLGLGYPAGPVIEQFAKLGDAKKYQFPIPMTTSGDFNLSFSGLKTQARNNIEKLTTNQSLDKAQAKQSTPRRYPLDPKNFNATHYTPLTRQQTYDFCASFQFAVFRHITYKLEKIMDQYQIKEVWLGGGVAANMELRRMLRSTIRKHTQLSFWNNTDKYMSGAVIESRLTTKDPIVSFPTSLQDDKRIALRVPYTKKLTVDNAAMIGIAAGFKLERKEFVENVESMERVPKMKLG